MPFGMGSSFNEPKSDDPTSAPQMRVPQSNAVNMLAAVIGKKKKQQKMRPSGALAQQEGRAKRARQMGQRWG